MSRIFPTTLRKNKLKKITVFILAIFICSTLLHAQTKGVSLHSIPNYNQWKWNSIVLQNGLITIAVVPDIGGRIMQYDLDTLPSIFVNSAEIGQTYTPSSGGYHNFGGYKTWPSPQGRWPGVGKWPPPPTLDFGAYTFQADSTSNDSVSITVTSPIEQWIAPGIQYVRKATIYPGTSRVKMEQTMINTGTITANWGMWSIIQSIVSHPGKTDYENFWSYFPINPNSVYGESSIKLPKVSGNAWKGEVAPGVYGVQFVPTSPYGAKVFADPHKGWIAYANISDTVVFARTFDVFEGEHYPDSARITVYVSNSSPAYMEVEVKSPLVDLAAAGGSYTFTENWWTAKVRAPILDVNPVGAIAKRLSYDSALKTLSGVYGIFNKGIAKVFFLDGNKQVLFEGKQNIVSPLAEVKIQETILSIPNGTETINVRVYNEKGDLIGVVDSADVTLLQSGIDFKPAANPSNYNLSNNYPNPFNPTTTIDVSIPLTGHVSLEVYDLLGRQVAELINKTLTPGTYKTSFDGFGLTSGIYFYCLKAGNYKASNKLVLAK
jgi:hypothetical protein